MRYLRLFVSAWTEQLSSIPAFFARSLFYVFDIYVFASLWGALFSDRATLSGFTIVQMVWYLVIVETIEFSKSRVFFVIQTEVQDGSVAVTLTRPVSYVLFHLSRAMGESCAKMVPFLLEGTLLASVLVGPLPGYFPAFCVSGLLLVTGVLIANLWMIVIGLLSFWVGDATPFSWIMQKLMIIMGGLIIPVSMLPPWFSKVVQWLPFAFSGYWPAVTMVMFSPQTFRVALLGASSYVAFLLGLSGALYLSGRRRMDVQAG